MVQYSCSCWRHPQLIDREKCDWYMTEFDEIKGFRTPEKDEEARKAAIMAYNHERRKNHKHYVCIDEVDIVHRYKFPCRRHWSEEQERSRSEFKKAGSDRFLRAGYEFYWTKDMAHETEDDPDGADSDASQKTVQPPRHLRTGTPAPDPHHSKSVASSSSKAKASSSGTKSGSSSSPLHKDQKPKPSSSGSKSGSSSSPLHKDQKPKPSSSGSKSGSGSGSGSSSKTDHDKDKSSNSWRKK